MRGGERYSRHVLGIGTEHRQLLEHEPDLGVIGNELGQSRSAFAAIGAIVIVEGDHADTAFGVAGDEALGRAEDLLGALAHRARRPRLLPSMADGE